MILYTLTGFSNYTNRTVKRYSDIANYWSSSSSFKEFPNINFKIRDGINTDVVVNLPVGTTDFNPDYLLATELIEAYPSIVSRWYVTECEQQRDLQYRLTLIRDIIADNYDKVINAPAKIVRGWTTVGDSAIYNTEDVQVNKVKSEEVLIKDRSNTPWIVGYISNAQTESKEVTYSAKYNEAVPENADIRQIVTNGYVYNDTYTDYKINVNGATVDSYHVQDSRFVKFSVTKTGTTLEPRNGEEGWWWTYNYAGTPNYSELLGKVQETNESNRVATETQINLDINTFATGIRLSDALKYDGVIYKDTLNNYKKIKINPIATTETRTIQINNNANARYLINNILSGAQGVTGYNWSAPIALTDDNASFTYTIYKYAVTTETMTSITYKTTITNNRRKLNRQPYSMFAIPYFDTSYKYLNASSQVVNATSNGYISSGMATAISSVLGSQCIDVQLVPYCPVQEIIATSGAQTLDLTILSGSEAGLGYDFSMIHKIDDPNAVYGFILWCTSDSFSVKLPQNKINNPTNALQNKVYQMTQEYRLCAPNYSSIFEFSPYKNGGVSYWQVDCTYKPYNPYIRVAPSFAQMYGKDYGDSRGLICGGDMSLPQVSDAWQNYQIAHKNYDLAFNRQVDTMEFKQKTQQISSAIGIGGSALASMSNPLGLVGLGSQLSGAILNDMTTSRSISDYKYMHQLDMENIQAIPQTLTKVSAQDINNKLFPLLEIYRCTESEVDSVTNYVKEFSMSINRIGKISDYLRGNARTWIVADLIRVDDIKCDAHELSVIKTELSKGVYII
ncbi:MAG: hypothetical protein MJZ03_04065 [archaeon]|nr:hypothetical protein [archaeon]